MRMNLGWTLVFGFGCLAILAVPLQAADVKLPEGWQQLSADDYAAVIRPMFDDDSFHAMSDTDKEAAREKGKQLFLQVDLTGGAVNYPTLEMLHWLARYELDSTQTNRAAAALVARQDDWTNRPYTEMRAKVATMLRLQIDQATLINEARKWVTAGGTIDKVPPADFRFPQVGMMFTDSKFINGSFSVEWSGFLKVPQTGDYTLSLSPINVNAGHKLIPSAFRMTVAISGTTVLDSSPDAPVNLVVPGYQASGTAKDPKWVSESQAIPLSADKPVAIKIVATAVVNRELPLSTLHALLYWHGPGVSKALIPASAFTQSDQGDAGLKATYRWTDKGKSQTLDRIDPMIDFAWTSSTIPLPQDLRIANQAADTMWESVSAPGFIASLLGPPVKLHPILSNPDSAASAMTTVHRGEFLGILLTNPSLLDPLNLKNAVRFYQAFRIGNPDRALDVFGAWAARHPDVVGEISTDRIFEGDERFACASLAINLTQQYPDQITRLEADFLTLPDGRCSLPVAYTLGCSYLGRKKYADWISILDAKLAGGALQGDKRVNWLLARANAAELSPTSSAHYPLNYAVPYLNPRNGRKYLDQALQAAESPAVKIRTAKEIVLRLVWDRQIAKAKQVFQPLVSSLPSDQKAIVAQWQQQLNDLDTLEQQDQRTQEKEAQALYLKSLQARRDQAVKRQDSDEAKRYEGLINAAADQRP